MPTNKRTNNKLWNEAIQNRVTELNPALTDSYTQFPLRHIQKGVEDIVFDLERQADRRHQSVDSRMLLSHRQENY
jgi:hypothetical protein